MMQKKNLKGKRFVLDIIDVSKKYVTCEYMGEIDGLVSPANREGQRIRVRRKEY